MESASFVWLNARFTGLSPRGRPPSVTLAVDHLRSRQFDGLCDLMEGTPFYCTAPGTDRSHGPWMGCGPIHDSKTSCILLRILFNSRPRSLRLRGRRVEAGRELSIMEAAYDQPQRIGSMMVSSDGTKFPSSTAESISPSGGRGKFQTVTFSRDKEKLSRKALQWQTASPLPGLA